LFGDANGESGTEAGVKRREGVTGGEPLVLLVVLLVVGGGGSGGTSAVVLGLLLLVLLLAETAESAEADFERSDGVRVGVGDDDI
jgi:hypothetical protein